MNCDKRLAMAIAPDCDNPHVGGMEPDGVIINRADVDFDACVREKNIISTLALKSGKKGFEVYQTGNNPFTGSNSAFAAGTYINKFTHQVNLLVFDHSAECSEKVIDQFANGQFIAVLKNKHAGADGKSKYQVYGYEAGLRMTEGTHDQYSEDTEGGWAIALQETAPTSGLFLYSTSISATDAAFESLKSEAAGG